MTVDAPRAVEIRPIAGPQEIESCASMMASSEPWLTLGRGLETGRKMLADSSREVYVAVVGEQILGFVVLVMHGALVGYIQTLCVAPGQRGQGLGRRLVDFAEARIFRESPNVFLCVSSFNKNARRLYERLGYAQVGEFPDFLVAGASEILMRKSLGPIDEFHPAGR